MSGSFARMFRPTSDSLLDRLLQRRTLHPDAFRCAVRVLDGVVAGESGGWRFAISGVDPLVGPDRVVTLTHGKAAAIGLRADPDSVEATTLRPGWVQFRARVVATAATVRIAVDPRELTRFGLDA